MKIMIEGSCDSDCADGGGAFRGCFSPKLSDSLLEPCHTGECPAPKGEYPELDSRLKHAGMTTPVDRKSLKFRSQFLIKS